jgi:hypothetical protein
MSSFPIAGLRAGNMNSASFREKRSQVEGGEFPCMEGK